MQTKKQGCFTEIPVGRAFLPLLLLLTLAASGPFADRASAQEPSAISSSQNTNKAGFVAEIIECKRKDGVLSIRMRIRNTGDKDASIAVIESRDCLQYYLTAGVKKYLILEDSEHSPLAAPAGGNGILNALIPKGSSWVWWAKYPAPPPEMKTISYYTPIAPPFDDVPITD